MEEHYHQLIRDYSEKRISDEGLAELREWIEQSPQNLSQFRYTVQVLEAARHFFKEPAPAQKAWKKIEQQIQQAGEPAQSSSRPYTWLAYAAMALLISAIAALFFQHLFIGKDTKPVYAEVSNPAGKRSRIILPDSSVVFLNAASKLHYLKAFNEDTREVLLDGEAFFEVVHDASRPFIVRSGVVSTTVLGTSFNVKAFRGDGRIAVTVQSGKVGVSMSSDGNQKFLQFLLMPLPAITPLTHLMLPTQ